MVISEGIRVNGNGTLSFGDYSVKQKKKIDNFEFKGDVYKIKTHDEVTRLEKNGSLFVESVPGASLHDFMARSDKISFRAEAKGDVFVTLELEPETSYSVKVDDMLLGEMKSSPTGKFVFSVTLSADGACVEIEKK
jgi:hypothetical protein